MIFIEMSMPALWFMVFGIMSLARFIGVFFVCAQRGCDTWVQTPVNCRRAAGKISAMLKLMGILPVGFSRAKVILEMFNFPRSCRAPEILLGMQLDVLDCTLATQQISPLF